MPIEAAISYISRTKSFSFEMKAIYRTMSLATVLFLCVISCSKLSIDFPEPEKEDYGMREWLLYLCSEDCEGRLSGTIGNLKAYDYLVTELRKMGYDPQTQEFDIAGKILRNIIVGIPSEKDSCIVIGAHFDGQWESKSHRHYPAANDNASGTVSLLKIAKDLKDKVFSSQYTIFLCFFDGEENTLSVPLKGSTYFVNNFPEIRRIKYYHNLDGVGHKTDYGFDLYYTGELMEKKVIPYILENSSLLFSVVITRGKGEGASDYVPFSKRGIPIINIKTDETDCPYHHHSIYDDPAAISFSTMRSVIDVTEDVVTLFN